MLQFAAAGIVTMVSGAVAVLLGLAVLLGVAASISGLSGDSLVG